MRRAASYSAIASVSRPGVWASALPRLTCASGKLGSLRRADSNSVIASGNRPGMRASAVPKS